MTWIVNLSLMTVWMACELLGFKFFGLTHLLFVGAIALELMRHPASRRPSPMSR